VDGARPGERARKRAEALALARAHPAAHPEVLETSSETGEGILALRAAIAELRDG
jgi:GTP-binding protein